MLYTVHRIQAGDSLSQLAQHYGTSVDELIALNRHVEDPDLIIAGMPLNVPGPGPGAMSGVSADDEVPPWHRLAEQELGVTEADGDVHNPRIVEYHQSTTLKATDDETPWCSSFVNWCVEMAGHEGTKSAAARSWLNWGKPLEAPKEGAVVVLRRGRQPWQGHVGFFAGAKRSHVLLLGGNQRNGVNVASYPRKDVLGYRWSAG